MAIAGLVFVAGKVYAPKAALIQMELAERKRKAKEAKQAQGESNVLKWPLTPAMPVEPDTAHEFPEMV